MIRIPASCSRPRRYRRFSTAPSGPGGQRDPRNSPARRLAARPALTAGARV